MLILKSQTNSKVSVWTFIIEKFKSDNKVDDGGRRKMMTLMKVELTKMSTRKTSG